jgi:hypothetical protein
MTHLLYLLRRWVSLKTTEKGEEKILKMTGEYYLSAFGE